MAKYFFITLFFVFPYTTYPADTLFLSSSEKYSAGEYLYILEDSGKSLSFEEISSLDYKDEFYKSISKRLDFGPTRKTVWAKLIIIDPQNSNKWFLELESQWIDHFMLYTLNEAGKYYVREAGANISFNHREHPYRNIVYALTTHNFSRPIYMKFEQGAPMKIALNIVTKTELIIKETKFMIPVCIYYGIVLLMVIVNMIYFIFLRDEIHLWYCGVIIFSSLGLTAENGLGFKYLWPEAFNFNTISRGFIACITIFCITRFVRKILLARVYAPKMNIIGAWQEYISLMLAALIFIFNDSLFSVYASGTMTILSFPVMIFIGIRAGQAGYKPAIYYFLGWILFALGAVIYIMSELNLIPNSIGVWGVYVGAGFEMVFFMFCLGIRFKIRQKSELDFKLKIEEYKKKITELEFTQENVNHHKKKEDMIRPYYIQELSVREIEVLSHMAIGLTDKEIAERLYISLLTVKAHARNIYSKLQAKNRTEAVSIGNKYNLILIKNLSPII